VFYGDSAIVFLYEPDAARRGVPAVDREKLRINLWRRALEVRPNSANVQFKLGLALYRSNPVEAAQHFRRALEIDPGFEAARRSLALPVGKFGRQPMKDRP
jgi:tetratricopeptide (TPR) repeat protein